MNRIPVIIDCDPGVDDTAALLLACQMPELDIRAVTTVAGNVGLDKTTANAKRVRRAIGANFPIYCGADKPMSVNCIQQQNSMAQMVLAA